MEYIHVESTKVLLGLHIQCFEGFLVHVYYYHINQGGLIKAHLYFLMFYKIYIPNGVAVPVISLVPAVVENITFEIQWL